MNYIVNTSTQKAFSLFVLVVIVCIQSFAQKSLRGIVKDANNAPLINASVKLMPTNIFTSTDVNGYFKIDDLDRGIYEIIITHLGSKSYHEMIQMEDLDLTLSIILTEDFINLENIILTGTSFSRRQMESGIAITTLKSDKLQQQFYNGTADLLQSIPSLTTDPSAGEVFTKVSSRGISASAQDDLGWYYASLQEDGLPISLIQHSYYAPDIFHRFDLMTEKLEVLHGGNASISATNAPGGIFNFISRGVNDSLRGEFQLNGALQGDQNALFKMDGVIGGPLGNNWFFNLGGHYRKDEGARNTDFNFSNGGQIKFNAIKENKHGLLKLYGKVLDDYTNRYTGVAATNWKNPHAAFGQDFNTTALLMPGFKGEIPDGRHLTNNKTNGFDPSKGVHAQDYAIGIDFHQNFNNDWSMRYNGKFSHKIADWQTSISNALVSLNDPLAYFISGADFPIGQLVFRDTKSGSEIARINNSGILAGESFEYLDEGRLPNDAIMGTSAWYKKNTANEWIDELRINKKWKNHDFNFGTALGISNSTLFTQGSFAYVTYEPNPRMLRVTLENPNEDVIALSDSNGLSNYGGLFFINGEAKVRQHAIFLNDRYKIKKNLTLDLGVRYENIIHKGSKDRFEPFQSDGGLDNDTNTAYDNGILAPTGIHDDFNYNYDYLSYSFGLNYLLFNDFAIFTSYSLGNKAPELDYYFNNFSNVPINRKGVIQKITQFELGLKWNTKYFSSTITSFISQLNNIGIINFEFDPDDASIFYTPIQFNSSRSMGLEWESAYAPLSNLTFRFNGTIQNAKALNWTVYNASGTVDTSDDEIANFSNNTIPFIPKLATNISAEYKINRMSSFMRWQHIGKREANISNAFQLPNYSLFHLGLKYTMNHHISADLLVSNLFNSSGLNNFFGSNTFGGNADDITPDFVKSNPNASFIVVPILPRRATLKLSYKF
ncbi:TonB-dependent receptor [Mariniflexile litorale]|uniref:TonB-dependent receptor n=1 Tax=Mariniflexile litorale TaxID=3045158 RepID=A0AAU7EKJ3_9FLAO|nr:TonB-dependent receptor [Mariniflexile sp. KMM 9835]MDQ8210627.1 TonB-dependent receptor [Mariniflexile sp. KMM 9835]